MRGLDQYLALSRRAVLNTVRQPTSVVPSLVFPLVFLALTSSAMSASTRLPGFPDVDSFLQFAVTATILQGALFGAVAAGSFMATDIQDGFFERLIASPVARTSILVGRVMGAAMLGFTQVWLFFGITSLFGLRVRGGILAMLLIALVVSVFVAGLGALAVAFAVRTGSTEAVQGSFPMLFALMFVSSAFFPRELMSGWFRTVATINPMSHMVEGLRTQVIERFSPPDLLVAMAVAGGVFLVGVSVAGMALRARLRARG